MTLILIWAILISLIILTYVLLDGFDLGVGILFSWVHGKDARDIVMSTVAPVWDGNETWLVFGAAGLYGAFPRAYGILLPILYMPIMIMLFALIFRGLAFEFRFKAHKGQWFWDAAFSTGSIIAALMQGMILGRFIQGYGKVLSEDLQYTWITPFSLLTGITLVMGYAWLGATWLILKTEKPLRDRFYQVARVLLGVVSALLLLVCLGMALMEGPSQFLYTGFREPHGYLLLLLLIALSAIIYQLYCLCQRQNDKAPFLLSMVLFVCSYLGFSMSVWPYIVPRAITYWEAAAPPSSLRFTLIGVGIILPILITYTAYAYYVFRGKVTQSIHY